MASLSALLVIGCSQGAHVDVWPDVHGSGALQRPPTQTIVSYTWLGGFSDVEAKSVHVLSHGGENGICRVIRETIRHPQYGPPKCEIARVPCTYHEKLWLSLRELDAFSLDDVEGGAVDVGTYVFAVCSPAQRNSFLVRGAALLEEHGPHHRFVELLDECADRFIDAPRHLEALGDNSLRRRQQALHRLSDLPASVLEECVRPADIIRTLDIEHPYRCRLNEAIASVLAKTGPSVVPAVVLFLKDADDLKKEVAMETLARLGEDARSALPLLQMLAKGGNPRIMNAARIAIDHIACQEPRRIAPGDDGAHAVE